MLSKIDRLKKKKDIERVFKKGKGFKEEFLTLKITKNNLDQTRFGFVVSRKVSKKATLRNKIKRQLSELVRGKNKKLEKGIDGLLVAGPGIGRKSFWEIEEVLNKLFKKAKCLKN